MVAIPPALIEPRRVDGEVACKLLLDLTFYIEGPSARELDWLIDWYATFCPADRLLRYTLTELSHWADLERPEFTTSGQEALRLGVPRASLATVGQRLAEGRAFELGYWDGREIDDPAGSWSLRCRRIKRRESGLHAFVRLNLPVDADPGLLRQAAVDLSGHLRHYSGHGGLVFAQDPWLSEDAFDVIYALSRRYWGIDIDDMNDTLVLMRSRLKGVGWLTLLGRELLSDASCADVATALSGQPDVRTFATRHGLVLETGAAPDVIDQHRPTRMQDAYEALAGTLGRWIVDDHPDFPGQRFMDNGNTVGWLRRFVEPAAWRN